MQKIKNVTQTVPYYLMPQNRPLTGPVYRVLVLRFGQQQAAGVPFHVQKVPKNLELSKINSIFATE